MAIDWLLDRFRTMTNVSGDLYAARIVAQLAKIEGDAYDMSGDEDNSVGHVTDNTQRV